MTSKIRNKKFFTLLIGVLLALLAVLFIPINVVQMQKDSFICYFKDDFFELSWIHSVEKEEWSERYRVDKSGFSLIESRFKTFGAGVPNSAKSTITKDGFVAFETDIKFNNINWIISSNVNSTLKLKDKKFKVYEHFEEYSELIFSTKKSPLIFYIKDTCSGKF